MEKSYLVIPRGSPKKMTSGSASKIYPRVMPAKMEE